MDDHRLTIQLLRLEAINILCMLIIFWSRVRIYKKGGKNVKHNVRCRLFCQLAQFQNVYNSKQYKILKSIKSVFLKNKSVQLIMSLAARNKFS